MTPAEIALAIKALEDLEPCVDAVADAFAARIRGNRTLFQLVRDRLVNRLFPEAQVTNYACPECGEPRTGRECKTCQGNALRNLLAVIHGDGGHYVAEHGMAKAAQDAEKKWRDTREQLRLANTDWANEATENARLRAIIDEKEPSDAGA